MSAHADALRVLTRWRPYDDHQRALQTAYVGHLYAHQDGLSRGCLPDHLTASVLVVNEDRRRVLLNLHRRLRIWVQFGGHFEPTDTTLGGAALREAMEETGIRGLRLARPEPEQLDTHGVVCGKVASARHLDVRYVATAPNGAVARASDESLDVHWFDRDDLPPSLDRQLCELITRATGEP